jgi:hypothetical protein
MRSGILIVFGTALLLTPVAIGLGAVAVATGLVIGALAVGLGAAGTAYDGRGTIPLTAHRAFDRILAGGLVYTGALFAVTGDLAAAALFAVTGLALLAVGGTTRYAPSPAS